MSLDAASINGLKVAELKVELGKRGLEIKGKKAELVARLTEAVEAECTAAGMKESPPSAELELSERGCSEGGTRDLFEETEGANLQGASLEGCDLSGFDLSGVSLMECSLKGAILTGTNLKGANLYKASLEGCDLTDVEVDGETSVHGAKINQAHRALFSGCRHVSHVSWCD